MHRRLFLLSLSAICCTGCSSTPTEPVRGPSTLQSAAVAPVVKKARLSGSSATLVVHGLSCPHCAQGVQRELRQIPGIRTVDLDPSEGVAEITYDEAQAPTEEDVKNAVRWGGAILIEVRQP